MRNTQRLYRNRREMKNTLSFRRTIDSRYPKTAIGTKSAWSRRTWAKPSKRRCGGIEKANPETLYGIFGDAGWTNKERLPDSLLRDLLEHFSLINLGNQAIETDILGQAYEYLIKKFADLMNKKAGEFYTPRPVVRLMVKILDPRERESIYDPACGTGGMLLEAINRVRECHGDDRTLWGKLFAQEKNLTTSAIARMNLFLHGASDFQVVRGDTLRQPAFFFRRQSRDVRLRHREPSILT
jgi:type I restriction-modification system DNA methylase subunit